MSYEDYRIAKNILKNIQKHTCFTYLIGKTFLLVFVSHECG